jgi:energy-coupling factor transporter ATP-binding protein EcfA2
VSGGDWPPGNPFASRHVRPGAVPFLFPDGTTLDDVIARLRGNAWRGEVVGPHGSGKSTLLAALAGALPAAGAAPLAVVQPGGCAKLPAEPWAAVRTPAPPGGPVPVLLLDGTERLGWCERRRLTATCRAGGWGLVVTAHRSLGLPALYRTRVTPALAARVVARLVAGGPDEAELAARLRRHGGDLRAVLVGLYDDFERRRGRE